MCRRPRQERCPSERHPCIAIFTEYDDTKRYLQSTALEAAIAGSDRADDSINIFHGPTPHPNAKRFKIRAFQHRPQGGGGGAASIRVRSWSATTAARKGPPTCKLTAATCFTSTCPWNTSRMEQRNGRNPTRKLQAKDEVFCHYFVYTPASERSNLASAGPAKNAKRSKKALGSPFPSHVDAKSLSKSYERRDSSRRDRDPGSPEIDQPTWTTENHRDRAIEDRARTVSGTYRKPNFASKFDRLRDTARKNSRKSIGLSGEHFQSAISVFVGALGH